MTVRIIVGDCLDALRGMAAEMAQCVVTSPPYFGLRDYGGGDAAEVGREATPEAYVARLVEIMGAARRVLRPDGTLWLNLGDAYAVGVADVAPKNLLGMPWRVAFALQADGWILRSAIAWAKPNPMPESVKDRPTSSYEIVFLLAAAPRYFYDAAAIAEALQTDPRENYPARARITGRGLQGAAEARGNDRDKSGGFPPTGTKRNARNVWTIAPRPFRGAHFAVMPEELAARCIRAGSRPGDLVLDPFGGAGTTGLAAERLDRRALLCELNPEYARLAGARIEAARPAPPPPPSPPRTVKPKPKPKRSPPPALDVPLPPLLALMGDGA